MEFFYERTLELSSFRFIVCIVIRIANELLLQLFYDADILEEKALFEWSNKVTKKCVSKDSTHEIHDKAAPFLTWLKEAEEEDSESEEEDDDLEVSRSFSSIFSFSVRIEFNCLRFADRVR